MQHIAGLSRQQLQIRSLEDKIALDNPVRFIEAFPIKTILILPHKKRGYLILLIPISIGTFKQLIVNSISVDGLQTVPACPQ